MVQKMNFLLLPQDIRIKTFQYAELRDLILIRRLDSKTKLFLAIKPAVWRHIGPQQLKHCIKYHLTWVREIKFNFNVTFLLEESNEETLLQSISSLHQFPRLISLEISTLSNYIDFQVSNCIHALVSEKQVLQKLESLECSLNILQLDELQQFFSCCGNLKKLSVENWFHENDFSFTNDEQHDFACFKTIFNCCSFLTNLTITGSCVSYEIVQCAVQTLPNLLHLSFEGFYIEMTHEEESKKLISFQGSCHNMYLDSEEENDGVKFGKCLQQLENLTFKEFGGANSVAMDFMASNLPHLKELHFQLNLTNNYHRTYWTMHKIPFQTVQFVSGIRLHSEQQLHEEFPQLFPNLTRLSLNGPVISDLALQQLVKKMPSLRYFENHMFDYDVSVYMPDFVLQNQK
jgi:hypothetical protein